jgi:hypothetical protein
MKIFSVCGSTVPEVNRGLAKFLKPMGADSEFLKLQISENSLEAA